MFSEAVFKSLFGLSLTSGVGFVGWQGAYEWLSKDRDQLAISRAYDQMLDHHNQQVKPMQEELKNSISKLNTNCGDKIYIFASKDITKTTDMKVKLDKMDGDEMKNFTKATYMFDTKRHWAQVFKDNLSDYDGLFNFSKILKKACEVESGSEIVMEYGWVPLSYRLFWWTGIKYGVGFRVMHDKFNDLMYGAMEGSYQSRRKGSETNIDSELANIKTPTQS